MIHAFAFALCLVGQCASGNCYQPAAYSYSTGAAYYQPVYYAPAPAYYAPAPAYYAPTVRGFGRPFANWRMGRFRLFSGRAWGGFLGGCCGG